MKILIIPNKSFLLLLVAIIGTMVFGGMDYADAKTAMEIEQEVKVLDDDIAAYQKSLQKHLNLIQKIKMDEITDAELEALADENILALCGKKMKKTKEPFRDCIQNQLIQMHTTFYRETFSRIMEKRRQREELMQQLRDSEKPPVTDEAEAPCFLPGTKILMGNETYLDIENIRAGQRVKSYNLENGRMENKSVLKTYVSESDTYYLINSDLRVTPAHPFLMDGPTELWKKASELTVGDRVISLSGAIAIRSIKKIILDEKTKAYNFQVADTKDYIVADRNGLYVVHNGL